jgi:hypothetical protein
MHILPRGPGVTSDRTAPSRASGGRFALADGGRLGVPPALRRLLQRLERVLSSDVVAKQWRGEVDVAASWAVDEPVDVDEVLADQGCATLVGAEPR